ncbi:MAG: hypothetical protein V4547_04395 [Bacteroidota bacterium]
MFSSSFANLEGSMQLNINNSRVSWSRHIGVSVKPDQDPNHQDDVVARARNNLQKIKAASKSSVVAGDIRKVTSECNLWNGDKLEGHDGRNWDSQSDPGSLSSRTTNGSSPKLGTPAEKVEKSGDENYIGSRKIGKKINPKAQGRGTGQQGELRKRHGTPNDGIAGRNGDFVVQIPEEVEIAAESAICCRTPQYLHSYFDFMYYSCLSTYKWDKKEEDEQIRCQNALIIIQKVRSYFALHKVRFSQKVINERNTLSIFYGQQPPKF